MRDNDGDNGSRPRYPFVIRFFDIDPMEAPLNRQGRLRFPVRTLDGMSAQMTVIPELITQGDEEDREKFWKAVSDVRQKQKRMRRDRVAAFEIPPRYRIPEVQKKKKK